jgi:hypothetical protein
MYTAFNLLLLSKIVYVIYSIKRLDQDHPLLQHLKLIFPRRESNLDLRGGSEHCSKDIFIQPVFRYLEHLHELATTIHL